MLHVLTNASSTCADDKMTVVICHTDEKMKRVRVDNNSSGGGGSSSSVEIRLSRLLAAGNRGGRAVTTKPTEATTHDVDKEPVKIPLQHACRAARR